MKLAEVIRKLDEIDGTIFAREPWGADSEAELAMADDPEGIVSIETKRALEGRGLQYFLEVEIARDVVQQHVELRPRTDAEKFALVLYYAQYDAYPDE
jgi:hypothetical protein